MAAFFALAIVSPSSHLDGRPVQITVTRQTAQQSGGVSVRMDTPAIKNLGQLRHALNAIYDHFAQAGTDTGVR